MIVESTNVENTHECPAFAKPLLCPRCGFQGRKSKYKTVKNEKYIKSKNIRY